jgi:hypothetical protein
MSILESLGTNEAAFAEATGTSVTATFELLPSGVYPATIKSVLTYTNQYGGQMMRYIVNVTEQDRDLEFRQDIGAALKPDANGVAASNIGYTNRIKQFCYAAGVELDSLSLSPTTVKIKSYGKDYDAKQVQGMTGKSVLALVRYSQDTEKADGESYQFRNDIEGVCATNGLDASGENAKDIFMAKVEKNPIFKFKGMKSKTTTATATPAISGADKAALASLI